MALAVPPSAVDPSHAVHWTMYLMPFVAVFGSLASGIISDKFFQGHRAPGAMGLYFLLSLFVLIAAGTIFSGIVGPTPLGIFLGCLFLVLISLAVNSTHSLLGTAAAMDIGGRKMAAFASGVIDAFQYFGAALAIKGLGWGLDNYGWDLYFFYQVPFGILGGILMYSISHRMSLKKGAA